MTGRDMAAKYLTNCTYLCEEAATIDGVQIYATPHQETIHVINHKMAFNLDTEKQLAEQFAKVPETADVLLTHGPPAGVGRLDRMIAGVSVGSMGGCAVTRESCHLPAVCFGELRGQ